MGITIEQHRARIGTFAAGKCSRSVDTHSPNDSDQPPVTHTRDTPPVVLCSMSWKAATLGLILVLLCALCHGQLLLIGGVESNPGPKSVEDILAALSVGAPDVHIRDCIRLYRMDATTTQHRKAFMKCDKATLVDTMNYLKVTGQSEYNKDFVVNNLIVRIQNLLPDTCKICNLEYCTDLDETAVLSCSLCGQAAHNQCLAQKLGLDCELLQDLGPEEAQSRINPLGIPGIHYLCGACEESVIPSTEAGKLRRRKNTMTPDSQVDNAVHEPQNDTDEVSQSQTTTDNSQPPLTENGPNCPHQPPTSDGTTSIPSQNNLMPSPGTGSPPSSQVPQPRSRNLGICSYFRKGTCRYGISGRGCPKQHPKACRKLILHGNRGPRGCSKGNNCDSFHPKMCHQSLVAGECLTLNCKLRHVAGTKRNTSRGRNQPDDHHKARGRNPNYGQTRQNGNASPPQQTSQQSDPQDSSNQRDFLEMLNAMRTEIMAAMERKMAHLSQQISAAYLMPPANQANMLGTWHTAATNQNLPIGPWNQMSLQHQMLNHMNMVPRVSAPQ